jgi:bifunctional non-homologous end joining protein LigD
MLTPACHSPQPLPLGQASEPFDDPGWLYEIKHDGFRAMAVIENGQCRFFSRNRHRLTGFDEVARALVEVNDLSKREKLTRILK